MSRLYAWQQYLSADTRRIAAHKALKASYACETPWQARQSRWVADMQKARRIAQDHASGRYLDAAFAHAAAPRPLMAPPTTTPWLDRARWTACLLGTAVRQVVDAVACLVGAVVGLARMAMSVQPLAVSTKPWGSINVSAPTHVLESGIASRLQEQVREHLENRPLQGHEPAYQFKIDHERMSISLGDKPWSSDTALEQKAADLIVFCDNDPRWAQAVSTVLNQFPANCAFETLAQQGQMHMGGLDVSLWLADSSNARGNSSNLIQVRAGEAMQLHVTCQQRLAMLAIGPRSPDGIIAPEQMSHLPCDGEVGYSFDVHVPRPTKRVAMNEVWDISGIDVTGFAMQSNVMRSQTS